MVQPEVNRNPQGQLVVWCLVVAILGILASHLLANSRPNKITGLGELNKYHNSCKEFIRRSDLPEGVRLGSKTPYQFGKGNIENESELEGCRAVQVTV